ncbi:MAG: 50S ribosomal protein L23 [Methanocorpusculum sp.]|nr:50S ribosomal protein L23 [Candidatus Methanocorpusculum equi]MCQ2357760.1 50S ribosomal protein L23 [Methanocorpusculum sp.]MDO5846825.1 50S ribosomal protein L23 [Methanocorpusculum sp.]HJJ44496.1 50S ribosomal protein L23 [Methanocorpusculum sp.]
MTLAHPIVTEKAMFILENVNQLSFLVEKEARKEDIKAAVEKTFGKKIAAINTMMTTKGTKKAIITFEEKNAAEEILSQLGIV